MPIRCACAGAGIAGRNRTLTEEHSSESGGYATIPPQLRGQVVSVSGEQGMIHPICAVHSGQGLGGC
jgi:hypothetical protein